MKILAVFCAVAIVLLTTVAVIFALQGIWVVTAIGSLGALLAVACTIHDYYTMKSPDH